MKDILDVLKPKQRFAFTGKYYPERSDGSEKGGEEFYYEYVDPCTNAWRTLFGNIQAGAGETAIRTDDQLGFKEGKGMVVLQDGPSYLIQQKTTDYSSVPNQSIRVMPVTIGEEYVLQLVAVEEPWSVQ